MDDYGLSAQDKSDLTEIRKRLPQGDPRRAKIDTLIGPEVLPPAASPAKADWRDPLTKIHPHNLKSLLPGKGGQFDAGAYVREGAKAVANVGAGGLSVLLHPVKTAQGMGKLVNDAATQMGSPGNPEHPFTDDLVDMGKQFIESPLETTEQMAGQTAVLAPAGEIVGKTVKGVANVIPKAVRAGQEAVTRTSPSDVANIVRETSAKNAEEVTKAADKTAENQAERKTDLKKHFNKTQAAKAANSCTGQCAPSWRCTNKDVSENRIQSRTTGHLPGTHVWTSPPPSLHFSGTSLRITVVTCLPR